MAITRTETLMWTALPGGMGPTDSHGVQHLRLSVFLSPRLETTAPSGLISEFPDFSGSRTYANWAALMQTVRFSVEFTIAGLVPLRRTVDSSSVRLTSAAPDAALWERIFPDTMPYKAFQFRDLSKAAINTFAIKGVSGVVKQQYQTVAATPLLVYSPPTIAKMVQLPGITNPPLIRVLPTSATFSTAAAGTTVQDTNFKAFEQFHTPYAKPAGYEPPPIPPMDFHKALSVLGNYPLLLQHLGIVVTLDVPFSTALKGALNVRVLPVWPDGFLSAPYVSSDGLPITRKNASPWTACVLSTRTTTVGTKLVTTATGFAAKSKDGKIKNGYLVARSTSTTSVSADPARLYNYNVDLAATRLIGTAAAAAKINPPVATQVAAAGESAAALPVALPVSPAVLAQRAAEPMGLPGLGQPVISMAIPGLAAHIGSKFASAAAKNALLVAGQDESITNYAEDLTRGYRVDVWDNRTRQWHRLCERTGTYAIGGEPIPWDGNPTLTDEGWVQFGAVSAPEAASSDDAPDSMRIHESVFDWAGWSLSVTRPGAPLSEPDAEGNTSAKKTFIGPDGQEHEVGHYLHPDLPLDTTFTVPAGSLPRLRLGTTYRFRARAVDLAGQSVTFSAGSTTADPGGASDTNTTVSRALVHQRYDPVKPPTVVLDEPTKPGESPEVLVVRSYAPPATSKVTEASKRHIAPPRTSVQMAEAAGGLDDSSVASKPMDKTLWPTLVDRDAWDFPKKPDGTQLPISDWTPTAAMPSPVPYLPDPFSKGAALNGLPGAPVSTTTRTVATGVRYRGVAIPKTSTTSITKANLQIDFNAAGSKWYEKKPFQIVVNGIEALDSRVTPHATPASPVWDAANRVLTVQLPKAEQITVDLSSCMASADIAKMGVYNWGLETHIPALAMTKTPSIVSAVGSAATVSTAAVAAALKVPVAPSTAYTAAVNALISTSVIGSNWMITPSAKLKLVHAVDTPLITPHFTSRAHAERKQGEVHAAIVDWMPVNGKSTSKLDVKAAWNETIDTGTGTPKWGPTAVASSAHAFTLSPTTASTTVLNGGAPTPAMMNTHWGVIPTTGMVINTRNLSTQRHFFGDTKHRKVDYTAAAASRFEKYFVDQTGLTFAATSAVKTLHVPSSARPAPPQIDYIIPTFGWTRSGTSSKRSGGGLRVYLKRPWFSSGESECLGVVLWQVSSSRTTTGAAEPFVTQWGHDPMFSTAGHLPVNWPQLSHFKQTAWKRTGLPLVEAPTGLARTVMAAAYPVDYDAESDRWFADIVIDQGSAYFPFVKLSLARFQPYALAGLELSPVVLADFAQLTPERNASIAWSADKSSFTLTVSGNTYTTDYAAKKATVTVSVEKKLVGEDVIGWTAVTSETDLDRLPRTAWEIVHGVTTVHWRKTVAMPAKTAEDEYRIVIREYEWHRRYGETTKVKRLVYAETLPVSP
jgi:hypothetical protein